MIPELPSLARQVAEYATAAVAPPPRAERPPRQPKPKVSRPQSIRAMVIGVFEQAGGRWLHMPTIRERVGTSPDRARTIRAEVCELHKEGLILRMGEPGSYAYRLPLKGRR
jgi:hypothetical protein